MTLAIAGVVVLAGCFIVSVLIFVAAAIRNRNRGDEGARRDPFSSWGILLQVLAFAMTFSGNWDISHIPAAASIGGMILMPASVGFLAAAVRHLGAQWRVQAVVTRRHRLVRSGPYAYLRHPIYTSLFGLMVGGGFVLWRWHVLPVACVVYAIGTEIRIRSEDGLLEERFGPEFQSYRRSVRAWIPFIR
jgi:protein-S-isoprenylcysteine O-methyltransferase Ste14